MVALTVKSRLQPGTSTKNVSLAGSLLTAGAAIGAVDPPPLPLPPPPPLLPEDDVGLGLVEAVGAGVGWLLKSFSDAVISKVLLALMEPPLPSTTE